jgi:hypothetical protein
MNPKLRDKASAAGFAWSAIGGTTNFYSPFYDPAWILDASGDQAVFVGQRGGVYLTVGSSSGANWSNWTSMGSPIRSPGNLGAAEAAVGVESDGRLVMFVSAFDGNSVLWPKTVWQSSQTLAGSLTSGSWSQWTPIGDMSNRGLAPTAIGQPAVFYGSNGALYIFVVVRDGLTQSDALWWNVETTPGSGQWSGWQNLGGPVDRNFRPSVWRNLDGRLEVFIRGSSPVGSVWHIWQTSAGGGWSSWESLGTPTADVTGNVVAMQDGGLAGSRAGCLELLVASRDNLYQTSQITPGGFGGAWYGWANLGGVGQPFGLSGQALAVATPPLTPAWGVNYGGTLEAYVAAQDNNVYRIAQQSPGGPWVGWTSLGGPDPSFPLVSNPRVGWHGGGGPQDILLQLFVLAIGPGAPAYANVYQLSQQSVGSW